jgi:hypothetical protein
MALDHVEPLLIVEGLTIQGSYDGAILKSLFRKKNGALSKTPKKRHSIIDTTYIVFGLMERLKCIPLTPIF